MNASQVNRLMPETMAKPSRSRRETVGEESLFAMVLQQSLTSTGAADTEASTAKRSESSVKVAGAAKEAAHCDTHAATTAPAAPAADSLEAASVDASSRSSETGGSPIGTEAFETVTQGAAAGALPVGLAGPANRDGQATGQVPNVNDLSQRGSGNVGAGLSEQGLNEAVTGKSLSHATAELPMTNLPTAGTDVTGSGSVDPLADSAAGESTESAGTATQGPASAVLSSHTTPGMKQSSDQDFDIGPAQMVSKSMPSGSQKTETGFSAGNESEFAGHDGSNQVGQLRATRSEMPASRECAFDLDAQALSASRLAEPDRTAVLLADPASHAARAESAEPSAALDVNELVAAWNLTTGNAGQTLTVRLTPDVFGAMSIRLEQTPEGLAARIQTDSQEAHALLAAQRGQLEELLLAKGFACRSIEIVWREAADRSMPAGAPAASRSEAYIPEQAKDMAAAYGQGQAFSQGQPQADRQDGRQSAWNQPVPPASAPASQLGNLPRPPAGASQGWHNGRLGRLDRLDRLA